MNYDLHYADRRNLCGPPYPEFRRFFASYARPRAAVLDLGCGQGRDALMAGRLGHTVLGLDLSAVGIAQMLEDAEAGGLRVRGRVGDLVAFRSRQRFDVVLLDRVLHLLPTDADRLAALSRLGGLTRAGSFVLVADIARHRSLIRRFFVSQPRVWRIERRNADFLCVERIAARRTRG